MAKDSVDGSNPLITAYYINITIYLNMDTQKLLKPLTMIFQMILIYLVFSFIETNFNPMEWTWWERALSLLWLFYAWNNTLKEQQ